MENDVDEHPLVKKLKKEGYKTEDIAKLDLKVHPCVELNLRCTMGVVCRLWYDQHNSEGVFRISPMLSNRHFKAEFLPTT